MRTARFEVLDSSTLQREIHNAVHQLVYKSNVWQAALNTKGEALRHIKVTDIIHRVDMTNWPENTQPDSTPCTQPRPWGDILRRVRNQGLGAIRTEDTQDLSAMREDLSAIWGCRWNSFQIR